MYDNSSFIKESLNESQTHSINIHAPSSIHPSKTTVQIQNEELVHPLKKGSHFISLPNRDNMLKSDVRPIKSSSPPQISKKQNVKETIYSNKPDQQTFIKYYEQNLQLKTKQDQLLREIKALKEKVNKNNQNTRVILESELKTLAEGKKSDWDTKKPSVKTTGFPRGSSSNKNPSTNKVSHLLQIIDHYKAKLITSEEENSNLKRQKQLLEQDFKVKERRFQSIQGEKSDISNFQEEINLGDKLKRNIRELELQKERSKFLELAINGLQAKLRASEMKSQELDSLKSQNRSLEEKIIRMTQLPNFNNVIDKAEEERRAKELQSKLKLVNQKYNALKDASIKTQAELRLLQNKLIESAHDINTLQKDNQTLRKQSISNPILLKLNNDPELVQRILIQIQNKKRSNVKVPENAKDHIQRLILQKQELAKQILNYQTRMHTLQQNFKEREKLNKLQKQETVIAINQTKATTSKQGVIYDGDTTVFSDQNASIPLGSNYFDLYIGEVNLLQTMIKSVTGLSNPSNPVILATVDFYNHNTEHSKLTQGCRCDLQSQFSFRVNEDDFFFKYLQKGSFQVDIWASEGNKNYHLGKATIQLKHLITKSRPRVSPVISTSAPLYLSQKVLGSINLIMRLRLPIFDQIQKVRDLSSNTLQNQDQAVIRRLVIQVDQGRGFGQKSNTFVYYPFRLEDHYTRTSKGNSPAWNHIKMLQINYDQDFKNYIRKGELQFTLFDDNVLVIDEKTSDVVGSAIVSLAPLLEGKSIKERLQIKKGNQRKGTIDIKIFWHEVEEGNQKQSFKLEQQRKLSPQGVHQEINNYMRQHNVDAEKIYRKMDDNDTGLVSFEEFQEWMQKISARKFTPQVLNNYYKGFKQPLNVKNFALRINQKLTNSIQSQPESVAAGLGVINQFLKINSTQMKKKSLQDYLVGKNILEVMNSIQTDKAGYITRAKLQEYFNQHEIQAEITGDRIKLVDFLRKHQKMNLTL